MYEERVGFDLLYRIRPEQHLGFTLSASYNAATRQTEVQREPSKHFFDRRFLPRDLIHATPTRTYVTITSIIIVQGKKYP